MVSINQYFAKEDQLGTVRLKISSLLKSDKLNDEEIKFLKYLNAVLEFNLLSGDSKNEHISYHTPGQQTLDIIEKEIPEIVNPFVKVYLLDILQINKRNKFTYAQQAIDLYLNISGQRDNLTEKSDLLLRVIQILKGLGKGNKSIMLPIFSHIKSEIMASNIVAECYSVTQIATAMVELKADQSEYEDLIDLIEVALKGFIASSKFECYRECCHALALMIPSKNQDYGLEVAKAYVKEADEFLLIKNVSLHRVAELYKKAFRIYKGFGLKSHEVDELAIKLVEAQKGAVIQMSGNLMPKTPIATNPNLQLPKFDNVYQGVYWLASMILPPKTRIQQDLERRQEGTLNQFFMGLSMSDSNGNVIGSSPDNGKQLYLDAKLMREIYCKSIIIPMYEHFTDSFAIGEIELNSLLYHSHFIPPERLSIYTRGLYHGFCGNFVEAVHILVPQIEHGLKTLLNNHGTITRKLNQEIQTEKNLQYFLDELKGVVSEDVLFDIDGLLNEAFGENLRHDLAHGLCETYRLESWLGLYTWWLALKLSINLEELLIDTQSSTNV